MGPRSMFFVSVCLAFVLSIGGCGTNSNEGGSEEETGGFTFQVNNQIPNTFQPCNAPGGNTVKYFYPGGDQAGIPVPALSKSDTVNASLSGTPCCGLGLQVDLYYWTGAPAISTTPPNLNPDNSGAQYYIDSSCTVTGHAAPVYGNGKRTWAHSRRHCGDGRRRLCHYDSSKWPDKMCYKRML